MSSEVGTGHISIFPVMTGFKSRVTRETKTAGAAGAKTFEGGFKGAGAKTGRTLGRDMKSALSSSAGDLGAAATKKLTSEVASASSALARVRLKQQDDAGRVRVAETRLAEAIKKSGEGSSQAVAAEERLASARRTQEATTSAVTAASVRLKAAQDALRTAQEAAAGSSTRAAGGLRGLFAAAKESPNRLISGFANGLQGLGGRASTAFQSVVSAAGRAASAAGQALGRGIETAATAAVTVAATGIGIALTKGFQRLGAIDTARAKLTGLGNDAGSVKAIMDDALASVRGTSFGLGEAATVAAGAVAAGIKPGDQLRGTLTGIANVAAAAGISMEETGGIFNKVAATGRAYTENLNQLADRGIPIWQALADQYGVTADEVRTMATKGEIDFQTFSDAAAAAAGTVAQEIGQTVPGAARNFFAAMGRIGANALQPVYGRIAPLILAATSALGPIEERAKAFGDVLLRVVGPALDWLTGLFTRIGEGTALASGGLSNLLGVAGPLGGAIAALGAGGFATLLSRIPLLTSLLPGLTGALGLLGGPLGIAAAAFAGFALTGGDATSLVTSITGIVQSVVAALPGLVSQIAAFVPQLVESILSQVPTLLTAGVQIVQVLVQGLVTAIPTLITGAVSLVQGILQAIVSNLPMIIAGAIALVMALLQGIITAIPLLIDGALQLVTGLLTGIVAALPMIIEGGIQLLMALVMGIIGALPTLLTAALDLVLGLLDTIIANLPMIIEAGIQLLLSLVTGLLNALPKLITTAIELVLKLFAGILTMLPKLIEAGVQLVVSLIKGLVQAIPQIIRMLPQIVDAIWNGLANVDWLGLGSQIIQGIIDGFFSMVGAVGDAIGSVLGGILDFFPNSPAKRGPLSVPGWRKLKSSGAATMGQFIDGAEAEAPAFGAALEAVAAGASVRAQTSIAQVSSVVAGAARANQEAAPGRTAPADARNAPTGDTYVLNGVTTRETADQLAGEINKKKRRRVARTGALREAGVS